MANCMSVLHDLEQHPTSLFSSLLDGISMDGLSCSTWCRHLLPNLSTKSLLHCDRRPPLGGRTRLVIIIIKEFFKVIINKSGTVLWRVVYIVIFTQATSRMDWRTAVSESRYDPQCSSLILTGTQIDMLRSSDTPVSETDE